MRVRLGVLLAAALVIGLLAAPPASALTAEWHPIRFPVEGKATYEDDFGDPRPGGRTHMGNDIFGVKLQRLVSAVSGVVTDLVHSNAGLSGNKITITGVDGWQYRYIHLNNDTPGTDDGANPFAWSFAAGMAEGRAVVAGQHLGFLGDSGNAEWEAPQLHFEIVRPAGSVIDPYLSLNRAARRPADTAVAVAAHPDGGTYTLMADGTVVAAGGAPHHGSPSWPGWAVARDLAVMPDGDGYVVLDAYGGVHRYGSAVARLRDLVGAYWPGWDIARAVALSPTGGGFAVLDGWGGVHAKGDFPVPSARSPYWRGWDIARDLAVMPDGAGYVVLDGYGGVHRAGSAVTALQGLVSAYWPGWDIARAVDLSAQGGGFAVLDAWGGVHTKGDAPSPETSVWEPTARFVDMDLGAGTYQLVRNDLLVAALPT